ALLKVPGLRERNRLERPDLDECSGRRQIIARELCFAILPEYSGHLAILGRSKRAIQEQYMTSFADLKSEYENLWATMKIRPERAAMVDAIARKLIGRKARYQAVEDETGVPWFVIAAVHNRESDADFDTYLGNGEPLDRETRLVPKGRGPFESWEEGAVDALELDHLDEVEDWTPARACYEIEKFNGFGYRNNHPTVKSPYLWSFTDHYTSGKYVGDGRF